MTLYLRKSGSDVYLVEKSGKVVSLFISEECARKWCRDHGYQVKQEMKEREGK